MAATEDAFKLLARIADAFDNPSSRESRKDFRVNTIKIHRPQTSRSSQESQVQHARYPRREPSFFDASYIYDDDELADTSTMGNRSCASSETIKSLTRITSYDDAFYTCDDTIALDDESPCDEMTKMLFSNSSPLDRLNNLARAELKKTGWFERPDQWSIVNMGLANPMTHTRGTTSPPKTPPVILTPILPSTPTITAIPPPSFSEIEILPSPYSPMKTYSPTFKASTPNGKYSSSSHDSFPDFSSLSYAPLAPGEPEPPKRFGVSSRVKELMKRVLHVNAGVHPGGRSRQSLLMGVGLRPASTAGGSSGTWAFASMGSTHTQAGKRWSGLWH
ncbi:hypothetical protein DEU56DRAFT_812846 [Suillus clintonianus]|uniref:uncharacterized protein n=1 Tax=Suillus clintonianus TaxID=1904413 RepID=UPI001B861791|nr:uncharacterized protein DEU56DRAFT_812846 [Suillus clintonianus]KAG2132058.1 hypothetical protein DEU56DRAFT_812846 [Suillus clintonianus]